MIDGASQLSLQSRDGQRGLEVGALDHCIGDSLDIVCDGAQKVGALFAGKLAIAWEGLFREQGRAIHVFRACGDEARIQLLAGERIDAVKLRARCGTIFIAEKR